MAPADRLALPGPGSLRVTVRDPPGRAEGRADWPRPAVEAEGREAVREIVASGVGIGFVSLAEFGEDTRLVPITLLPEEDLTMDEALICLQERRHSKLVEAFFDMARQAV
mgnify:CR=1 FL=1